MKTESVWCPECDHEHECEIVSDEFEDYPLVPDNCEACGAIMVELVFGFGEREDFHADG